jgi:16S rRNA (guanine527-N7)-methyltransferase
MPTLSPETIATLVEPYVRATPIPSIIYDQLQTYLELILKWNTRINLTAIRGPEQIVRRHFGESLFAALHLNFTLESVSGLTSALEPCDSLLDLGSGAGFPGIPIQLIHPELSVTLAESRTRKAAFLHEVTRTLGLSTTIWANRAEAMPSNLRFHTVTLRAVDEMNSAIAEAAKHASRRILILGTQGAEYPSLPATFRFIQSISLPNSQDGALLIAERIAH